MIIFFWHILKVSQINLTLKKHSQLSPLTWSTMVLSTNFSVVIFIIFWFIQIFSLFHDIFYYNSFSFSYSVIISSKMYHVPVWKVFSLKALLIDVLFYSITTNDFALSIFHSISFVLLLNKILPWAALYKSVNLIFF